MLNWQSAGNDAKKPKKSELRKEKKTQKASNKAQQQQMPNKKKEFVKKMENVTSTVAADQLEQPQVNDLIPSNQVNLKNQNWQIIVFFFTNLNLENWKRSW